MKKFWLLFFIFMMCFSIVYASDVQVQMNGKIIDFTDEAGNKVNAQIINGRTMVPLRKIFNELGVSNDDITWIASSRTVIAKKGNTEITLQIENENAKKICDGQESRIRLDSKPVIVEGRTLVPLRFIAESFGKTVGWDALNRTAIIIDYDVFLQYIKTKSSALYDFVKKDDSNIDFKLVRKYYDLEDSSCDTVATVSGHIEEQKEKDAIYQIGTVNFSGTEPLMKEIASEGWAEIQFKNRFYKDEMVSEALNSGLKKIYGKDSISIKYSTLNCEGNFDDSTEKLFQNFCAINEKLIDVNTFSSREKDFKNLLNQFKVINAQEIATGEISSASIEPTYFDFTKLDNLIWNSSVSRCYDFINGYFFKYDVVLENLRFDFPKQSYRIKVNGNVLLMEFSFANEYNEKFIYELQIVKN